MKKLKTDQFTLAAMVTTTYRKKPLLHVPVLVENVLSYRHIKISVKIKLKMKAQIVWVKRKTYFPSHTVVMKHLNQRPATKSHHFGISMMEKKAAVLGMEHMFMFLRLAHLDIKGLTLTSTFLKSFWGSGNMKKLNHLLDPYM